MLKKKSRKTRPASIFQRWTTTWIMRANISDLSSRINTLVLC